MSTGAELITGSNNGGVKWSSLTSVHGSELPTMQGHINKQMSAGFEDTAKRLLTTALSENQTVPNWKPRVFLKTEPKPTDLTITKHKP